MPTFLPNIDYAVLEDFRKGSEQAFKKIFRSLYPTMCSFAQRLVANEQVAQELVEDCFIKLWERREKFDSLQAARAFLYVSTKNSCLTHIKQNKRLLKKELLIQPLWQEQEDSILNEIIRVEVLEEVSRALQVLPRKIRKVIHLSFVEGLENARIAEQLGVSVSTVKNQKARGLFLLRKYLRNSWVWFELLVLLDQVKP